MTIRNCLYGNAPGTPVCEAALRLLKFRTMTGRSARSLALGSQSAGPARESLSAAACGARAVHGQLQVGPGAPGLRLNAAAASHGSDEPTWTGESESLSLRLALATVTRPSPDGDSDRHYFIGLETPSRRPGPLRRGVLSHGWPRLGECHHRSESDRDNPGTAAGAPAAAAAARPWIMMTARSPALGTSSSVAQELLSMIVGGHRDSP